MTKLQTYIKEADQQIVLANHLLTRTFPLSNDLKILLSVLQVIHSAHEKIFLAVLDNDFLRPKISLTASFIIKFDAFSKLVLDKKLLSKEELNIFKIVEEEWQYHKDSSVEFVKDDNIIMADNNFKLQKINEEKLKDYINKTTNILKKLFNR